MANKNAQIQFTFNWIYILIAGAVILLFFIGLVVKQKAVSEENLAVEISRILDSIFTGAGVAEKTKSSVSVGSLRDYTLQFSCQEGVSRFSIKGTSSSLEDSTNPLFSPSEIKSSTLSLWSLPYSLPFKVSDFLFITSPETKYVLLGQEEGFIEEFLEQTVEDEAVRFKVNRKVKQNLNAVSVENYENIRIIDFVGEISNERPVSENLKNVGELTAVQFLQGEQQVNFYEAIGGRWILLNKKGPIILLSFGDERDAVKYAAIFSGNNEIFECNMQKALQRLLFLDEIYENKLDEIKQKHNELISPVCKTFETGLTLSFEKKRLADIACLNGRCSNVVKEAKELNSINEKTREGFCYSLY